MPQISTASACATSSALSVPNMCPVRPPHIGWVHGMISSEAIAPCTTAPQMSANRDSSSTAPEAATPSPARITGVCAARTGGPRPGSPRFRYDAGVRQERRHDRFVGELVQNVLRQGEEHRPTRRSGGHLERPADQPEQAARVGDARGVLGDRPGHVDQVHRHVGLERVVRDARLAGQHHHRRLPVQRVIEAAHGVAQADAAVQQHHAGPAGGLGVPVGGAHHRGFLKAQHVLDVGEAGDLVEQALLAGAGVAEQVTDPVGAQLFEQPPVPGGEPGQGLGGGRGHRAPAGTAARCWICSMTVRANTRPARRYAR